MTVGQTTAISTPAPAGHPDAALVHRAAAGDRDAMGLLYRMYAPIVHGVLLASVSRSDADDLTQEVFITALKSLNSLREPAALGAWLMTAARRRAMSHLRAQHPTAPLPETAPSAPSPQADLSADQVLDAIRSLPEAYRETLALRLVENLTGPEIAARTGMTEGSVRVNLHRGMQQLRTLLGAHKP